MNWGAFFSAFGLVFVAELGDKTQLAVLTQTCKYRRPRAVFVGASTALVAVTALGAIGGRVLGGLIPRDLLRVAAALAFVVMGLLAVREATSCGAGAWSENWSSSVACDNRGDHGTAGVAFPSWEGHAFCATFGLLFLAELGDKTQLAVLGLSSEHEDTWAVLGGAALALALVTALGVIGGRVLGQLVPRRLLLWASAVVFILVGVWMGLGVLWLT